MILLAPMLFLRVLRVDFALEPRDSCHAQGENVAMAVYKRGRGRWYRFVWSGESIRESTKQSNKRPPNRLRPLTKRRSRRAKWAFGRKRPFPRFANLQRRISCRTLEARLVEPTRDTGLLSPMKRKGERPET
jgi:hypothetical protein